MVGYKGIFMSGLLSIFVSILLLSFIVEVWEHFGLLVAELFFLDFMMGFLVYVALAEGEEEKKKLKKKLIGEGDGTI